MSQKAQHYPVWVPAVREDTEDESPIRFLKNVVARLTSAFTAPMRLAISKPARRIYLTSFFFFIASIVLLTISSVAYSIFYFNYIPQISLEKTVYLQFGDETYPYGIISLSPQILTTNQAYDVSVTLDLPRTSSNIAAGNFMLDLQLLSSPTTTTSATSPFSSAAAAAQQLLSLSDHTILSHSRRPAILNQPTHTLLSLIDTLLLRLPWSLLTYPFHPAKSHKILTLESDTLSVPLFEAIVFPRSSSNPSSLPNLARLEIQTLQHIQLQIYSATLSFHAKFTGLKYLVYNYRITSFLVFTAIFYMTSISTMAVAWLLISLVFWVRQSYREHEREKKRLGLGGHKSEPSDTDPTTLTLKSESEPPPPSQPPPIPSIERIGTSGSTTTTFTPASSSIKREPTPHDINDNNNGVGGPWRISSGLHPSEEEEDEEEETYVKPEVESEFGGDSGIGTSVAGTTGAGGGGGAESSAREWSSRGRSSGRREDEDDDEAFDREIARRRSRLFGDS